VGRPAHALPQSVQVGAATQRAAKTTAPFTRCGGPAAGVTPSEPKVSDWRGGRAAAGHHRDSAVGLQAARAPGVAGGRGDDLARAQRTGAERSAAQRRGAQCASSGPVRQAGPSVAYPRRTSGPAIPGHGTGRLRMTAGAAGLTELREGWKPVKGRDADRRAGARCAARQPGPAQRGRARSQNSVAPLPRNTVRGMDHTSPNGGSYCLRRCFVWLLHVTCAASASRSWLRRT
jgi:hypothetical protein